MLIRIISKINQDGITSIFKSLRNKLVTKVTTYTFSLEGDLIGSGFSDYRFERMTIEHLLSMKFYISSDKYILLFDRMDSKLGLIPYVVICNGMICGYYHVALNGYYDTTVNFNFNTCDDSAFLFDDHTFPHSRGKGCHKFSILKRMQYLKSHGYSNVYVNIVNGNVFSERSYSSLGFYATGSVSCYFRKLHKNRDF